MQEQSFGYRIDQDAGNGLVTQEIWGVTTPQGLEEASHALGEVCAQTRWPRILMLVARSDARFSPAQFISMFEGFVTAFPHVRRVAYMLDLDAHDTEQMLLGTLAWRHQIKVAFFADAQEARDWVIKS